MHKLTISVNTLKSLSAKCSAVSGGASIIPILDYAKITIRGKEVIFQSTDTETSIETKADCANASGDFCFLWSIKDMNDVLSKLPEMPVSIEYDEATFKLFLNTIAGNFEYQSESPDLFPQLPDDVNDIEFEVMDGFLDKLKIAADFTSSDTLRPSITGVLFDIIGGELYVVGCDMSSLYLSEGSFLFELESTCNHQAIVPGKTIKKLSAFEIKGEIKISINSAYIIFKTEKTNIYSRLVDAKYPDYRMILPEYQGYFSVDLKAIQQSISLLLTVANNVTNQIEFTLTGNSLELKAADEGFGKRGKSPVIEVKNHQVNNFSFTLNGSMAQKIFRNLKSNAIFYNDGFYNKAFIFKTTGGADTYLLMPLMTLSKN